MSPRLAVAVTFLALIAWFTACSKGIGNNLPARPPRATTATSNLPVGVDLGVIPTGGVVEPAIAGFTIPAFGTLPERDLVLLAFATAAAADDADGAGTALARDTVADANGASDVFVAAVCAQDVETRAFSQVLAGKFRHPRCTTCHSMQAATTQAFASSALPHAGPLPGTGFPANDPSTCSPCHVDSTAFPVVSWQAPAASFDMRTETVAQLADRATRVPAGDLEHFVSDPRVLWALDSGILPTVGGRNGVADDDHDGVAEPEDEDGVPRTVPGGSANFIQQIEDWNASGRIVTAAAAVKDVTLASRAAGGAAAANGASRRPKAAFVPNPGFNPASAVTAAATNPVGTLFVVFESDAADLSGGDGNAFTDVYRARIDVRVEEDANGAALPGGVNLVWQNDTVLVSAVDGTGTAGNGASTRPAIGGASAQFVAFQSEATNLIAGFTDGNGALPDVFVRRVLPSTTQLVSHAVGNAATGGNGASEIPAIDPSGVAVAFESDASDLVASDLNALRDVFHARIDGGSPFTKALASVAPGGGEATGGASGAASVFASGTRVLVAFQSAATNLAPAVTAATNVYLFDSATGATTLLNQRASATGNAIGNGDATAPVLSTDGSRVVFASAADNIDVLREDDGNRAVDLFVVETAQVALGNVLPFRASITAVEGADADGASAAPAFAGAAASAAYPSGMLAYTTTATNLGTSDSTNVVVAFLAETSGVFAAFTASTARGAVPLQVTFTDQSTGSPTSWQWDFDNDGTVDSTAQSPTHVYTAPGLYTVRLVAANANSNGEVVETDLVLAVGPGTADFTVAPPSGVAPLTVTFTDTSSQSPTAWQWDFDNDGTFDSTLQNPTHQYTTPGVYSVRLVATNEAGEASVTKANLITAFTPVVAEFSGTPLAGVAPLTVDFTDLSTGDVSSWQWDFDNNGVVDSTAQNPSHQYTTPGNYTVRLVASGDGGTDTETKIAYVAVAGAVVANFSADATSQYDNVPVNFTDLSTGTVTSWAWDFDNNGVVDSTAQNPSFTFSTPGTYTVKLTASGPGGTDDEIKAGYITSVASSITVTFGAAKDTSIYSSVTTNSNGANVQMVTGRAYNGVTDFGIRRAFVEFDVSSIPNTATVLSTSLQLECTYDPATPTGAQTVSLHRVTREWTEGTTNSGIGGGGGATGNDATWVNATSGGSAVAWTSAGGDFAAGATRSTVVNTAGTYTWATSASMVSDVQGWINNTANNHGWVLRAGETVNTRTAKVFGTRNNATPANRPVLTVTYRPAL